MARSFNGSTQFLLSTKSFSAVTPFSMSAWVQNNSSATGLRNVLEFDQSSGGGGAVIYLRIGGVSANTPEFGYFFGSDHRAVGASTLSTNTWYSLVGTYDGATYKIYTNGTVATSSDATGPNFAALSGIGIGSVPSSGSPARFWNGLIADAAVWNVALTAAEASALANGARPYTIREQSLARYYPLDGLQSPEPDLSGTVDNAALTAAPPLAFGPPAAMFTPRWPEFILPPPPSFTLMPQILL